MGGGSVTNYIAIEQSYCTLHSSISVSPPSSPSPPPFIQMAFSSKVNFVPCNFFFGFLNFSQLRLLIDDGSHH